MIGFLKSLSPENSGETWLLMNDPKCKVQAMKRAALAKHPVRGLKSVQQGLYEDETV